MDDRIELLKEASHDAFEKTGAMTVLLVSLAVDEDGAPLIVSASHGVIEGLPLIIQALPQIAEMLHKVEQGEHGRQTASLRVHGAG